MQLNEDYFRSILLETIDENPLACRAVLLLCKVEFTSKLPTLSVSLGNPSVLRVNLDFLQKHCATEKHVKALLIHEFLHILLGHTMKFEKMTPALNLALDAIINAIIHRKLGEEYSSMMATYYAKARGLCRLLRPLTEDEKIAASRLFFSPKGRETPTGQRIILHDNIYKGLALAEDVFSIAESFSKGQLAHLLDGLLLLGDHDRDFSRTTDELSEVEARKLKQALVVFDAAGILRKQDALKPESLKPTPLQKSIPATWIRKTLPLLQRFITPDPQARARVMESRSHLAPILNTSDRRGALKALWNPLIPDIAWETVHPRPQGSVQVYLDVSRSMNAFNNAIIQLLSNFATHIRSPFWAFSTEVHPARIVCGKLETKTTGGTAIACVYEHIEKTRPTKALIITDGFVERPAEPYNFKGLCQIEAIIPHDGYSEILKNNYHIPTTVLTPLPNDK